MANADYLSALDAEFEQITVKTAHTNADIASDSLIAALNDVSASASVSIHRQNGSGKESLTFLDSFAADKFSPDDLLQHLKNTYGTGDYRIHVRENGKLRANRHVSIEAPRSVSRETSSGEVRELIAIVQQTQAQLAAAMQQLARPAPSEDDFLEKMLKYKALFGNENAAPARGFGEILETVNGLKMLGINVGGIQTEPPADEEKFTDIIEKIAPMVTAIAASTNKQQPAPAVVPRETQKKPDDKKMNVGLKIAIGALIRAAKKNADTAFYADVIIDQVPQDKINLLLSDSAFDQLAAIEPMVIEHKNWFLDVLEHVRAMCGLESKYSALYENDLTSEKNESTKPANDNNAPVL